MAIRLGPAYAAVEPVSLFNGNLERAITAALTFALPADFFEQLDLNLLNFEEPIVLTAQ